MTTFHLQEQIRCAADLIDSDLVFSDDPTESVREFYLNVWLTDIDSIPDQDQPEFVKGLHHAARDLNERFRERQFNPAITRSRVGTRARSALAGAANERYLKAIGTVYESSAPSNGFLESTVRHIESRPRLVRKRHLQRPVYDSVNHSQLSFDLGDAPGIHPLLLNGSTALRLGMWGAGNYDLATNPHSRPSSDIRVVGVGGAGCRIVESIARSELSTYSIAINTDKVTLAKCEADVHLTLGEKLTHGLGAGSNPEVGREAAERDSDAIREALSGADIVIVAVGLGGGTGSGATPVVMKIARDLNILTMAVVTTPQAYEARNRRANAKKCLSELQNTVDTLVVISNTRGRKDYSESVAQVSFVSDRILSDAIRGFSEIFRRPAMSQILNVADIKSKFAPTSGQTFASLGAGSGSNRVQRALHDAFHALYFSHSRKKPQTILVSLACDRSLTMEELQAIDSEIKEYAAPNAEIIGGASYDPTLNGELRLAVLAGGMKCNAA